VSATAYKQVARPLTVLVPLILEEIRRGQEAAKPFYAHAGELLLEAKSQIKHGDWEPWIRENLGIAPRTVREWMQYAKASPWNQNGATRAVFSKPPGLRETTRPNYQPPGKPSAKPKPHAHAKDAHAKDTGTDQQELANRLVDAGYKVLAKELHPDKEGGSTEAMTRLNEVRSLLKEAIRTICV
jgi:hypothetical protein